MINQKILEFYKFARYANPLTSRQKPRLFGFNSRNCPTVPQSHEAEWEYYDPSHPVNKLIVKLAYYHAFRRGMTIEAPKEIIDWVHKRVNS